LARTQLRRSSSSAREDRTSDGPPSKLKRSRTAVVALIGLGFHLLVNDAAAQALQDAWTNPIGTTGLYQGAQDVVVNGVTFHRPAIDFLGEGTISTCPGRTNVSTYTPYEANCVDPYTLAPMAGGEAVIRYTAQNEFSIEPVPPHAGLPCNDSANSNSCSDMLLTATLWGTNDNPLQPRAEVERTRPRRPDTIVIPPREVAATVLELAPAPAPSALYDGLAETQALRFESSGKISGTCLYWSRPRWVGRTPTYEFTMLACTWDLQGTIVSAAPCPTEGCEYFQSSAVVAPPSVVIAAENPFGTAVGWRFNWAGSSPYTIWADVQAIEVVYGIQTDLRAPHWQLRYAFDVDDSGDIIGYGRLDGYNRGFLILHEGS
jgi:hypothetical protein